jgi:DNA-binding winged helix-turn-helix (wHTH) protein/tetratricopeptide (TPR) repeat protein
MPSQGQEIYRFGRFRLSPSQHSLYLGEVEIPLAPKSFEVLLYLARNPGRLVSKEELLQTVWSNAFIEEANLAQQIFRLRKAFEMEPGASNLIRTVPGRGYQFTAEVSSEALSPVVTSGVGERIGGELSEGGYSVERWRERTHTVVEEMAVPGRALPAPAVRFSTGKVAAAAVAVVALTCWGAWRWHGHGAPIETQQIVLADFANSTGDAAFERTLRRALEVDLEQSPYMDVMNERTGVDTLRMMGRAGDVPLTGDVAREACRRNDRKILIEGNISSVGPEYLVTLEASDCTTGKRISSAKAVAKDKGHVLAAVDTVAEKMRSSLGESAKSLASYQVPLSQATTPSLEALTAYSMGKYLAAQGKPFSECKPFFERAIELDPQFAMAYRELGSDNYNLSQMDISAQYFQKAFDLSDRLSTREQLYIRASYYAYGQHNLIDGIKTWQLLASTYPQDPLPIADMMDEYDQLGQYGPSIALGERGVKQFPDSQLIYENLGEAYMHANRFDDFDRVARRLDQVGKGDTGVHLGRFYVGLARQDQEAVMREDQWFTAHEDGTSVWYFPSFRGKAAAAFGKYQLAEQLFQRAYESAKRANLPEAADKVLIDQAKTEFELGFPGATRDTLRRVQNSGRTSPEIVCLETTLGDTSSAERFLALHSAATHDTLMTYVWIPRVRAALALQHGKPLDAIAVLEPARPYEMRDYTVPWLRAEAYQKAGQAGNAIEEYKKILANPGIDPTDPILMLSHLGVARALASQSDKAMGKREYESFFAEWKNADATVPVLKEARLEYARLL